jgi:glycogen(starch) synthase
VRSVSVVINTYNRAASLRVVLTALEQLDYERFEVVVVNGPSTDDTETVLNEYADRIKSGTCANRNLSESRNIGIALAAGDIVAFIDDDAYPDPAWLNSIVDAFDDEECAGAGGPVYDYTGARLQARYSQASVFGAPWVSPESGINDADLYQFPGSTHFTYTIGTNAAFRRDRLLEIGGFDEEFEYYLDETDVCRRLLDRGYIIRALNDGYVYHKFLPSAVRTSDRAIKDRYAVLKNTAYFALHHGLAAASFAEVCISLSGFLQHHRTDYRCNVDNGLLSQDDFEQFESDIPRAFDAAFAAYGSGTIRTRPTEWFAEHFEPFHLFNREPRARRLHICLMSQEYPPETVHGIGRVIFTLACGLARAGHVVRVLTRGASHDRVDFENGVWVHRIVPRSHDLPDDVDAPQYIWDYSATMLDELKRIESVRRIDVVQAPNWDAEGIAPLRGGEFPLVIGLYTPIATVASMEPMIIREVADGNPVIQQLIDLDKFIYEKAQNVLAASPGVVHEIEDQYQVSFIGKNLGYVPHGLDDVGPQELPASNGDACNLLFVGRLEARKGIDLLLAVMPDLVARHSALSLTVIGDDRVPGPGGRTFRAAFEDSIAGALLKGSVQFLGQVDDAELRRRYLECDILVAPSRFESFGLILVEAMMFGKPVIGCDVGGMRRIVEAGRNGILVPPGDRQALEAAIDELAGDAASRADYGKCSREIFEARYSSDRMAAQIVDYYLSVIDAPLGGDDGLAESDVSPSGEQGLHVSLRCPDCRSQVQVIPAVITVTGRLKTGQVLCRSCQDVAAAVDQFRYDWGTTASPLQAQPPSPRVVADLGERRLPKPEDEVNCLGTWRRSDAVLIADGRSDDQITYEGVFSDALIRILKHPWGGIIEFYLDGDLVLSFDSYMAGGSQVVPVTVANDLDLAKHVIMIRGTGTANRESESTQVAVEEIVAFGPITSSHGFEPAAPINRGNPYSAVIGRYLDEMSPDDWILECGGGDRRRCNPRHINFEYLDFEFADMAGDMHSLPFADNTFSLVLSQAVFEHVRDPFLAARELIRVTKPGGLILTEVAFLQPLHAVPYHYFNMTQWGVEELFADCDIVESNWFGGLGKTVEWMLQTTGVEAKVGRDRVDDIVSQIKALDPMISHEEIRPIASGVYVVARKELANPQ